MSAFRSSLTFLRRHWLVAIGVLSLIALVLVVDPVKLAGVLRHVNVAVLAVMLPVVLLTYALRAVAWWIALRTAGIDTGLLRTLAVTYAGHLTVFMPVGDLARAALLMEDGTPGEVQGRVAGTIAFQELTFLTLLAFGVVPYVISRPDIALLLLLVLLAHGAVFAILLWERAYNRAVGLVERWRWLGRFDSQLRSLRPAVAAQIRPWSLIGNIAFNGAGALGMISLFYLSLVAVGVGWAGFVDAAFTYSLAHIVSGLSFLPGGVGSLEAVATGILAARGVPPSQGAAAALLFRGFNDAVMVVAGAIAAAALRHRRLRMHTLQVHRT